MSPVSFAGNARIAECAQWLFKTPRSQHPRADIFAAVLRGHFKLTSAELIIAVREADRLRETTKDGGLR